MMRAPAVILMAAAVVALGLVPILAPPFYANLLVPFYGWLGTRVVRIRLITIVMTFFAITLIGFYAGGIAGFREGIAFYIWIGLINVFIVSQFWQFANDLFTEQRGRRLGHERDREAAHDGIIVGEEVPAAGE